MQKRQHCKHPHVNATDRISHYAHLVVFVEHNTKRDVLRDEFAIDTHALKISPIT